MIGYNDVSKFDAWPLHAQIAIDVIRIRLRQRTGVQVQ